MIFNPAANETAAEYIRDRIRERVQDPAVAELLCPTDHPYGTKRATFETNYYETFNLPHVRLIDARTTPIARITGNGIATTAQQYEFDVIVLATGFDVGASRGSFPALMAASNPAASAQVVKVRPCWTAWLSRHWTRKWHLCSPVTAGARTRIVTDMSASALTTSCPGQPGTGPA